ncbi:serine hydrolase domain-containing protein [Kangiella taiwanensis]|uniref:Serine hydrolase domain-containing protein n=1 Tax=Kangiella taiwanensis TaxID=1079179 RepID=A0ABP8HWD7_9GAMM|nr:serine hydrolase domain-containing protein [Kangiella taiwanensis]
MNKERTVTSRLLKLKKAFTITAMSAMLLSTSSVATAKVNQSTLAEQLDPYFEALAENNRLLGSMALYKGNEKLYSTTLEVAGDGVEKNNTELKYKTGSITKTFTAALVFQLIEEKKLSLQTKLSSYYPKVANAERITIGQMLNHQSGIHSYTDDPNFIKYHMSLQDKSFLIDKIRSFEADFEPGEKTAYSNSNYLLLGYILEQIEEKSYAEQLEARIFKPLGMTNTLLGEAINPDNGEAFSYQLNDGKWQEVPQWDMSVAYSAGALVSTTDDLNLFITGLFNGKLISASSLEQMIELEDGFGKGIFGVKYELEGAELQGYWHNGGIESFISHLAYYPEKDLSVVVLTNGMDYDIRQVYQTMLDAYFGKGVDVPEFGQAVELDAELLKPLVGDYESGTHPLDISISLLDGQLYAQATGQGGFPLTALSEDRFEFSRAGIEIRFDRENDQFEIKQGGRADVFLKVEKESSKKAIEVPLERLKQYVGTYQSDDFPLDIEVILKEQGLYAQATGQSAFPLTPVDQKTFSFKLADIVIEFDVKNRQLTITQRGVPHILTK